MSSTEKRLEAAIPDHLRVARTRRSLCVDGALPPFPTYVARFKVDISKVVIGFLGIQSKEPDDPRLPARCDEVRGLLGGPDGPKHWDGSAFIDQSGYRNRLYAVYWDAIETFEAWRDADPMRRWWADRGSEPDDLGYFLEVFTPAVTNYETHFSTDRTEGIAALSETMSGEIAEHAYWGGARDRIPLSQTDALEPDGEPAVEFVAGSPHRRIVRPAHNLCLIRSGQDWSDTSDAERALYDREIRPHLEAGMRFLEAEGLAIGCYSSRFVDVVGDDGQGARKSFGISLWKSLAHLEKWAASHPTHLKIYGSLAGYMNQAGPTAGLRTYHEISVLPVEDQTFEYVNCHDKTGMLNALAGN